MMFRDDHTAALARADALEEELERERAERRRLEAEHARLEAKLHAIANPPPPKRGLDFDWNVSPQVKQPWDAVGIGLAISVFAAAALFVIALVIH